MTPPPCPHAERIRDELLRRFDQHFADPAVRVRLARTLDVAPATLTRVVQHVADRLFPESFADDYTGAPGLVPTNGLPRAGADRMRALAEALDV